MLGQPKYTYGDIVQFKVSFSVDQPPVIKTGEIIIIDRWGTWDQDQDVSYDIMVPDDGEHGTLYKHFIESSIIKKIDAVPQPEARND